MPIFKTLCKFSKLCRLDSMGNEVTIILNVAEWNTIKIQIKIAVLKNVETIGHKWIMNVLVKLLWNISNIFLKMSFIPMVQITYSPF